MAANIQAGLILFGPVLFLSVALAVGFLVTETMQERN